MDGLRGRDGEGVWVRLGAGPEEDAAALRSAGALLRRGGLVAFPTETVYGLGADALNPQAVARIFAAKGRPADNPLIVHVTGVEQAGPEVVAHWPPVARRLAERFWPGPLTLVLPAGPRVPAAVRAGLPTVAVRCPAHPVAQALIAAAGTPVAAPSANRSGRPSPTRAEDVWADLGPHLDLLLDAGPVPVGVESTVIDVTAWPPRLLRPGGLPVEELEAALGVSLAPPPALAQGAAAPAPGMKYRHYAPEAPVVLAGDADQGAGFLRRWLEEGQRVALVGCREDLEAVLRRTGADARWLALEDEPARPAGPLIALDLGPRARPDLHARRVFRALRAADAAGSTRVLALAVPEEGLGRAVMNRLRKAAAGGEVPGREREARAEGRDRL